MEQPREKLGNDGPKVCGGRHSQREHVPLGALKSELDVAGAGHLACTENLDLPVLSAKDKFASVEGRIQGLESIYAGGYSRLFVRVDQGHGASARISDQMEGSHASTGCNLTANFVDAGIGAPPAWTPRHPPMP